MHDNDRLQGVNEVPSVPPEDPAETLDERTRVSNAVQLLLARGDRRGATEVLIDEYGERIYAYCMRALRDPSLAEDVQQQVFLEAYRDLDRFAGRSSPATWLYSIAAHRCIDAARRVRKQDDRFEPDEAFVTAFIDPTSAPGERLDQARLVKALESCLQELSRESREAVLLRFQVGLTYEQMALVLEAKADTLCARVSRALPVLKECLEEKGWTHE